MWCGRQLAMYNLKEEGNHHHPSKEVRIKRLHLRSNCVVCGYAATEVCFYAFLGVVVVRSVVNFYNNRTS